MSGSTGGFGSDFMNALLDPGVQALAGMAQGFASAAMPSRLPISTGAALGMGLGGLGQGAGNALTLQKSSMQNQLAASQLPAELAKNQSLATMWQNYQQQHPGGSAATPFGAPPAAADPSASPAVPSPSAAPASVSGGGATPASNPAIQPLISASAQKYGIPVPLATAYLQQESSLGTNPAAKGNIGQITSATAANPGYGMQPLSGADLTDPAKNIDFSLQYLRNAGDAAGVKNWNDPSQWGTALQAYNGGGDPNYVQNVARWLPKSTMIPGSPTQASFQVAQAGGGAVPVPQQGAQPTAQGQSAPPAPVATAASSGMAPSPDGNGFISAADALNRSQQYFAQANALEGQQKQAAWVMQQGGPPSYWPPGDPVAIRAQGQKFLDVALAGSAVNQQKQAELKTAGQIAAATSQAQLPAELTKLGFRATPGGGMEPIPGGVADPAYVGAAAAAKATADAAASRTKLITTRAGVFDPVSGQEIYRQPEYHELQDPNTGQEYPAFVQPGANGQLSVMGGPPGMASGAIPPSKLGPGQEKVIEHLADQYANEDKQKYEGATNSLFQLSQQDQNIAALNQGGGWSATGTGANTKMEWAKGINSVAQSLGVNPIIDPAKVASWEDATKIQTQLAFAQAKQLGSREAQQVISMSRAATPGAENTPQGYQAISSGYHEMNNREVDAYNFKTAWLQSHGGNLQGAETAFNNQFTPSMYAARAISTVNPVNITATDQPTAMAQMSHYLPGTVVKLANGKQTIVPPNQTAPPIPSYIQSYLNPSQGAPNAP